MKRWALLKLAVTYCDRKRGKRSLNLEQAIRYVRMALQTRRHQWDSPRHWASAHLLLAITYQDRVGGDKKLNVRKAMHHLRKAMHHLQKAADVFTRRRFPDEWAAIQQSYGHLLPFYPGLPPVRRYLLAIHREKLALQVWKRTSHPMQWAELQQNLGHDYKDLFFVRFFPGDLEMAHWHYQNAMGVYRRSRTDSDGRRYAEAQFPLVSKLLHSQEFKKLRQYSERTLLKAAHLHQN